MIRRSNEEKLRNKGRSVLLGRRTNITLVKGKSENNESGGGGTTVLAYRFYESQNSMYIATF